jgi:hypothetical protein
VCMYMQAQKHIYSYACRHDRAYVRIYVWA